MGGVPLVPLERSIRRTRRTVWISTSLAIAALAIGCVGLVRQSQSEAVRLADQKAQAVTQVNRCRQQVTDAPKILRILGLMDILATNSIIANQEAIDAQPDSPLTDTRRDSLARLRPARQDLRNYISGTKEQIPTEATCDDLAKQLGVTPTH